MATNANQVFIGIIGKLAALFNPSQSLACDLTSLFSQVPAVLANVSLTSSRTWLLAAHRPS